MGGDLVLITGATGHIGFHVLVRALEAGYRVRAAVRSQAKADALRAVPALQAVPAAERNLSFVVVPDLTLPGAYDAAFAGDGDEKGGDAVRYVIHIASPLARDDIGPQQYESELVGPAVKGTLGMLEAARRAGGVRRIVITSSIASLMPVAGRSPEDVYTADSRFEAPADVSALGSVLEAYGASKLIAFNETEAWVRREQPAFDVVNVHPSFVMGREEVHPTPKSLIAGGTNRIILGVALGVKSAGPLSNMTVHIDDVARVHVDALKPDIPGNTSYIVSSNSPPDTLNGSDYAEIPRIVAKHFPKAVESGLLPNNGSLPGNPIKADASKTEKTFGFVHKSFEDQVKDVVGQYLELVQKN
ncbi:NAD dependent epimerase/dehydratase [Purpureocillium lavendulum]|uniref:NAD dependent epimerase/dehydratase n=1 Tax=Purpureocillium lavendulum TaxID=1247861 RepID=A0AB34FTP8_9HYPO|nr:NAD dependent epimerase/dehydratase [Purpureocillium lavendulum]